MAVRYDLTSLIDRCLDAFSEHCAALSSDPLRPQYEELRAGGLGDVSRLGLAPDPLATPLYWSPFSPVPRRGRPNLLRRFFAPGFMGMGGV